MDSLKGTLTPMKMLNGRLNGGIAYGTFNYNELENKPSVNGTKLVGDVTIDIPTKTSDLDNDSGFITDSDVPTKTSELTNDSGFITDADVPTKTSELDNDSGFITSEDIPTIPTATSQLNNDSGFLTMNTTPVKSVNSQTGDVNLFIPNATSQLSNDAGFITDNDIPVQSVNGQTGEVELTSEDISYDGGTETVKEKIDKKATAQEIDGVTLVCQRCPITSISNSKAHASGKINYFSTVVTFGSKGEASAIYFQCSLFGSSDFCFGNLYDNNNDKSYTITKGNSTSLWVFDGSTRVNANTFAGKSNIFINLVGVKP